MSFTPAEVAERVMNAASAWTATRRESVVLPVPGGPQRSIDTGFPDSTINLKAEPGASNWGCPTTSSRLRGRIRVASGADREARSSARELNRSVITCDGTACGAAKSLPTGTIVAVDAALIGSAALWAAIASGGLSLIPALSPRNTRRLLTLATGLATLSTLVLGTALIAGDFSLAYVAETTSRATPWPYRLSALWGGMDGSMLFYATMSLLVGTVGLRGAEPRPIAARIVALVGVGYLLIAATIANPFEQLDIPAIDGEGLLAILQHPAMVYHPPILYLGLTTLLVPFALTIEQVARGRLDRGWIEDTRRWLLVSWTLLTVGMLAGANWAYVELGWGGFWAWDPVENTALMPWLAATVFIHTSRVQQRDGRLRRWNALFALLPFVLTILGVYLTRSGVTGSIHAFAEDPVIGRLLLTAAVFGLATAVFVSLRTTRGAPWDHLGLTRDTWLATSGGLVSAVLVFVTVGSAYPAYSQVFLDEAVSVDSDFFVTTIYGLALLIAILTGFALETRWKGEVAYRPHLVLWAGSAIGVAALLIVFTRSRQVPPIALAAVAGGSLALVSVNLIRKRPMGGSLVGYVAHLGLLMVLIGAGGSSLGDDFSGPMAPGESVEAGGRVVTLDDVRTGESDRFVYVRARFLIDGEHVLSPEIRAYEDQPTPVAEPALWSTPTSDVIVAISRFNPEGETLSVSVFVRPMVWWVWAGAGVLSLAGLIGLLGRAGDVSRRHREARGVQRQPGTTSDTSVR